MAKAYSYIRMSTPEQLKGDSYRRQLKAADDYIREHGLDLAQYIDEKGISAFKSKNSEFGALSEFINACESGLIEAGSYLIVESLDRLTRDNILKASALFQNIISHKINIVTLSDKKIYSSESVSANPMELLIPIVSFMRAHDESKIKSERLSAAWEEKRKKIRSGMIEKQNVPAWLYIDINGKIEKNIDRVKIVRNIFALCNNGYGAFSICKKMNYDKILPWGRAKYWQESSVKKILANRSLLGEFQPHTVQYDETGKRIRVPVGDVICDYYPRIVSDSEFAKASESMSSRRTAGRGRKGNGVSNLFSGLLKCGYCGNGMRFINKGNGPKGGRYLRCCSALLSKGCLAKAHKYELVEHLILRILKNIDFSSLAGNAKIAKEIGEIEGNLANLRSIFEKKSESMFRLVDAVSEGVLSNSEVQQKISILRSERSHLDLQIKNLSEERNAKIGVSEFDFDDFVMQLNLSIEGEGDSTPARFYVSDKIKRVVRYIKISEETVYPWEFTEATVAEEHESELNTDYYLMKSSNNVAMEKRDFFKIEIKYSDDSLQIYNQHNDEDIYMPGDDRFVNLRYRSLVGRISD